MHVNNTTGRRVNPVVIPRRCYHRMLSDPKMLSDNKCAYIVAYVVFVCYHNVHNILILLYIRVYRHLSRFYDDDISDDKETWKFNYQTSIIIIPKLNNITTMHFMLNIII